MTDAAAVRDALGLAPHPEGGWFRRTWEHPEMGDAGRRLGSSILFLVEGGGSTRWHRVDAAEVWVHCDGDPLVLEVVGDEGPVALTLGGADSPDGPQTVVPPGAWQRARSTGAWSLVVCVVVPEFSDDGFELAPDGWEPGPGDG
ncbi:MAG: cupin domain-containing protein [Microthrixaceae bacterium]